MIRRALLFSLLFLVSIEIASAKEITISVSPSLILQGEPALVVFIGAEAGDIKTLTWNGKKIPLFTYVGKTSALIGVDLYARAGTTTLTATVKGGGKLEKKFFINRRKKVTAPLGIPAKLGGNTPQAQTSLVATLTRENTTLSLLTTTPKAVWTKPFTFPVALPVVTDAYGYLRKTGYYDIAHKGADFRANVGTTVTATNDGVVRLARRLIVYGNVVVIDHGGGVSSLYMHLSALNVKEGQKVRQGDSIGLSGDSGYALSPHLHLSIRIGGVSIDPVKFFALFGMHP